MSIIMMFAMSDFTIPAPTDFGGMWCLVGMIVSILCFITFLAGFWKGASTCLTLAICAIFFTGSPDNDQLSIFAMKNIQWEEKSKTVDRRVNYHKWLNAATPEEKQQYEQQAVWEYYNMPSQETITEKTKILSWEIDYDNSISFAKIGKCKPLYELMDDGKCVEYNGRYYYTGYTILSIHDKNSDDYLCSWRIYHPSGLVYPPLLGALPLLIVCGVIWAVLKG